MKFYHILDIMLQQNDKIGKEYWVDWNVAKFSFGHRRAEIVIKMSDYSGWQIMW